ncbi:MAG TPA: 3-phosphoshikimate 1-carboxyvinyltransferase [Chitinophagaceae bacterium]
MKAIVSPSFLQGTVTIPASKSAMQRACAAALIRQGKTVLQNPGVSADDQAALGIIQQLGAQVQQQDGQVQITSSGIIPVSGSIDCGESGLSVRMFTSIAALSERELSVTGSGSLTKRPLDFFNEVLPLLGVECASNNGTLPLKIKGPLHPRDIEVDGTLSSQFLTGLLFSYAAAGASDVTITVRNLNSKPYIDLTLQVIEAFGLKSPVNRNYEAFYFPANRERGMASAAPLNFAVEGDWSGAAFLLVAGAVNGDIIVKGLDAFSTQADKAVLQALMQAGALMSIEEHQIHVRKSSLKAFHFNAVDCPDLFPPLVSLAAYCEGTSVIEGVHRLAHKESNRALTLQEEFGKMGIEVTLQDDLMLVKGGALRAASVHAHHDHRIAMACAVAALRAEGDIIIGDAQAVNKSYPQFWEHLQILGAPVIINDI